MSNKPPPLPSSSQQQNQKRVHPTIRQKDSSQEAISSSVGRANKRARVDGSASENDGRTLSKGAQWMIEKLEKMGEQYREAVKAAVTIVQYRMYCKRIGIRSKRIPPQLSFRLNNAWASYDTTRRHIESYMAQNAAYATSPYRLHTISTTGNTQSAPPPTALEPAPAPASPIPLSNASFLSHETAQPQLSLQSVPAPPLPLISQPYVDSQLSFPGDQQMDLSNLAISELTAIINGDDYSFPNPMANGQGVTALTPNTQAVSDKLFASLSEMPQQDERPKSVLGDPNQNQLAAEQNVDALLASLENATVQILDDGRVPAPPETGDFSFDINAASNGQVEGGVEGDGGGVDLSDLVGLFTESANQQIGMNTDPIPQKNIDALLSGQEGIPNGEYPNGETYDLGGIDLDDFNFENGSMPNVEGDEFEELFAEFK